MKIALDAMGGDYGPSIIVEGISEVSRNADVEIILVGDSERIERELKDQNLKGRPISVLHAESHVDMHESPKRALRDKTSSIFLAVQLVKDGKADAVISAGNTGAMLALALFELGRLKGVDRPVLVSPLPTLSGRCFLLDAGANADCSPKHLLQFALMGSVYAEDAMGKPNPRVGLLSIGAEPSKGNKLTLETNKMLQGRDLNFIGNVEGGDIVAGKADVVICDGFVGNVVLKTIEGVGEAIHTMLKDAFTRAFLPTDKSGAIQSELSRLMRSFDYSEYGGAPLLGVNGVCIVCHGRSNARAIRNAIIAAVQVENHRLNKRMEKKLREVTREV